MVHAVHRKVPCFMEQDNPSPPRYRNTVGSCLLGACPKDPQTLAATSHFWDDLRSSTPLGTPSAGNSTPHSA